MYSRLSHRRFLLSIKELAATRLQGKQEDIWPFRLARDILFAAAFVDEEADVVGFGASRLWR